MSVMINIGSPSSLTPTLTIDEIDNSPWFTRFIMQLHFDKKSVFYRRL